MSMRSKAAQGRNQTREGLESPGFSRGEDVKNESGLIPLGYRVIIETKEKQEKTEGGIYLPQSISEREEMAQMEGFLVAKGKDAWEGEGPEVGSEVLFAKYSGYLHTSGDKKFRVVNDEDIVAVIEGEM